MNHTKVRSLLEVLAHRPREFVDRLATFLDARTESFRESESHYEPIPWEAFLREFHEYLACDPGVILSEKELEKIQTDVSDGAATLSCRAPFSVSHNADPLLAQACYLICRALQPTVVVETGTAYGVTSAFILQALEANGRGQLYSVDLPPLGVGSGDYVGILIPRGLRHRWQLHRGTTRRVLPGLLREVGRVDVFLHDSLHTYRNMRFEFAAVTPFLCERGAVIVDDVDENSAFSEWVEQREPKLARIVRESQKRSMFGVALN